MSIRNFHAVLIFTGIVIILFFVTFATGTTTQTGVSFTKQFVDYHYDNFSAGTFSNTTTEGTGDGNVSLGIKNNLTDLSATDTGNWLSNLGVYGMDYDSTNDLVYIGGVNGRFGVYNTSDGILYSLSSTDPDDWLGVSYIFGVSYDSTNNLVYIGAARFINDGNFGVYNVSDNILYDLNETDTGDWLGVSSVYDVSYDSTNNLVYIGADSGKFGVYNRTTNVLTDLSATDPGNWLGSSTVLDLEYNSNNNLIYIGAGSGKFGVYNVSDNILYNLSSTDVGDWLGSSQINSISYDSINNLMYIGSISGKFGVYNVSDNILYDLSSTDVGNWMGSSMTIRSLTYNSKNGLVYLGGEKGPSPFDDRFGVYNYSDGITYDLSSTDTGDWLGSTRIFSSVYDSNNNLVYIGATEGKFGVYDNNYYDSGSFTSQSFDASSSSANWTTISWNNYTLASTNLSIYTRNSHDNSNWDSWIYNPMSSSIINNQSRYLQYKATLSTDNTSISPKLYNVTISYTLPTNLTIYDDTDSTTKQINQDTTFTANFTSLGESINGTGIYCEITFNDTGTWSALANMTFNSLTSLYEYNKSFSSPVVSSFFNTTCYSPDYETIQAVDEFAVYPNLNLTMFMNDSEIFPSWPVFITGHLNWSNGTNVSGAGVYIYENNSIANTTIVTTNLSGDYNYTYTASLTAGAYEIKANTSVLSISAESSEILEVVQLHVNLTLNLNDTTVYPSQAIFLSGHINLTNSTNVVNTAVFLYQDNSTLNTTNITTNSSGDYNYTFTAPASVGVYEIRVNTTYLGLTGTQTAILEVVSVPATTPSGGSSGGGSGTTYVEKLTFNPNIINLDLIKNTNLEKTINVKNDGTSLRFLKVSQTGLSDMVILNETIITLRPAEQKIIKAIFVAGNSSGIFTGKILFNYEGIPVSLNVRDKEFLFDSNIVILNKDYFIKKGNKLKTEVTLVPKGDKTRLDVVLNYVIKDYNNKTILTKSETVLVEKETNFEVDFDTGSLAIGQYIIGLEVLYDGKTATSSAHFEVVERGKISASGLAFYFLVGILFVSILITARYLLNLIRKGN